jgi:hypothetical protein
MCRAAPGVVVGECAPAMLTPALSGVIGAERAVPVLAASFVRFGEPEDARLGEQAQRGRRCCSPREQKSIRAEVAGLDVGLDLRDDLRA